MERIGLQKGIQQGEQRGEVRFALQLLTRRFGSLPIALQAQIEGLTIAQLDSLSGVLLDFETVADLEEWLSQQEG